MAVFRQLFGKLQGSAQSPLLIAFRGISTSQHLLRERCMNSVQLLGRVGGDPKSIELEGRSPLVVFSLATNRYYQVRSEDGTVTEKHIVTWHPINVWKTSLQRHVLQNISKGSRVLINGRLDSRMVRDDEERPRETAYIVAEDLIIFPSAKQFERDVENHPEGEGVDYPELQP